MVDPLLRSGRRPGPACETFYPEVPSSSPVTCSSQFRQELSYAFCETHLLSQHSIIRAYLDNRSLWDYRCQNAVARASAYYPLHYTPLMDLQQAKTSVYCARVRYQRTHTLQ